MDGEKGLSLLSAALVRSSPFAQLRKNYLNLARLIHPDKLSSKFNEATKAFQARAALCVRA
eukprot:3415102-Pleurochrysis_carterae.AAC.1